MMTFPTVIDKNGNNKKFIKITIRRVVCKFLFLKFSKSFLCHDFGGKFRKFLGPEPISNNYGGNF
jgi:hypothetical protein